MEKSDKEYDGPALRIEVTPATDGSYAWEVMLSAPGRRTFENLGYKASGTLASLESDPAQFEILVHDEHRAVWTPMPVSHRKDIRSSIETLIRCAAALIQSGTKSSN